MIDSYVSGKINIGDLICIDGCRIGFYLGRGCGDSVQFYTLNVLDTMLSRKQFLKPYVSYIMGSNVKYRIKKYSPDLLSDEHKKKYDNALIALEKIKEINNNKKRNK